MRALVQRADGAAVSIHGEVTGSFDGPGLVVLVGVTHTDTPELAARLAAKVWGARLFDRDRLPSVCVPPGGPAELSASDVGLPLLVIDQHAHMMAARRQRELLQHLRRVAAATGQGIAPVQRDCPIQLHHQAQRRGQAGVG